MVLKERVESEGRISFLTRQLDAERVRFHALSGELQVAAPPSIPAAAQKRRTPETNMIDSVSRIVHRCRAAKITAEQAELVTMLQISTMAKEKYELAELRRIVRERVSSEVAQLWGSAFRG
jgi:hemoglobin-like flavoprotein